MGVLVGLLAGAGLFLIWWSCWTPGPARRRRRNGWPDRVRDTLAQAGMASLDLPGMALVCLLAGAVTFALTIALVGIRRSRPASR